MSSPKSLFVLLALALLLGGCTSFRPLYADMGAPGAGGDIGRALARINVSPIPEREGVQLRNDLIFALRGRGDEAPDAPYRLDVALSKSASALTIAAVTGRPTAAQLAMIANYALVRIDTGERLFQGRAIARASFDQTVQRFANIRAARDAEDRAARELADMIRNGLAAYFAREGR